MGMLLAAEAFVRGRDCVPCAAPSSITSRCSLHFSLSIRSTTAMTSTQHYDVIIIGSGAGGGTLAFRLAPSGKRILMLERGGYVPREKDNWSPRAVNVETKYHTSEAWRTPDRHPLHPHTNYYVGGNTKFYGAALFRLRREDFGEMHHAGGLSPAWPISYDDLEPYYTEAERIYQVHGERGVDPTEPPASGPYPFDGGQSRAPHPEAARRSGPRRPPSVPHAARRHARRARIRGPAAVFAATPATASRASSTRSRTRKSAASSRRCAIQTSRS